MGQHKKQTLTVDREMRRDKYEVNLRWKEKELRYMKKCKIHKIQRCKDMEYNSDGYILQQEIEKINEY